MNGGSWSDITRMCNVTYCGRYEYKMKGAEVKVDANVDLPSVYLKRFRDQIGRMMKMIVEDEEGKHPSKTLDKSTVGDQKVFKRGVETTDHLWSTERERERV